MLMKANQMGPNRRKCLMERTTSLMKLFTCFLLTIVVVSNQMQPCNGAAVMSVDLGSEWMKVGVVSPGVPMEIALNKESKRKTPALLAFRDHIRTFGEDALTVGIRDPAASYGYLLDLLGKTIDNPIVDIYRKRFPYYEIVGDPVRNTVVFKKSDKEQYSVEELIAQMLVKAKEFAQDSTSQPITECVLTVPGFFGQAEREALLSAAQLANLKVLQLINDYTAVALNYGVFHRAEINETAQYFIFYDMGASKTSAAVVSYQLVKDKQTKEISPLIQVLGVGYDRTLGGLELQLRLRDYLAQEFNALKKTSSDVTKSPRALAKLFKEAGRLKNVLSANNDHYAQIENLIDDQDFKLQVTREKLEELAKDLWPRVIKPLEKALAVSGLTLDVIQQVIIFGGSTRVPKVQELLKQYIKQELGKSLNADEAATMGAVYKAADLATGFKVKRFIIRDAVIFPLQVTFERDPGDGNGPKQVRRLLFGQMNPYPQKKVITFNKHTKDFDFLVHYGDLNYLSSEEVSYIGSLQLFKVELLHIQESLEKAQKEMTDTKGIKAYFLLDDSGIIHCSGVELIYDKPKVEEEDESTLSKLSSTISKLFSKEQTKDPKANKEEENEGSEGSEGSEAAYDNGNQANDSDPKVNKTEEMDSTGKSNESQEQNKNETIKLVTVKEPIEHHLTLQFTQPLEGDSFKVSLDKLNAINRHEEKRMRLESSFNALESHVIDVQAKLEESEYASCATEEEKKKILQECSKISEWLYEDIENPSPELYEKKLNKLKELTKVFLARHWEHNERPEALNALDGMLEHARKFLDSAKNLTKDNNPEKDVYTQIEIDSLAKVIDETTQWRIDENKAQMKLNRHDDVRLSVKDITDKMSLLDREVKYLVNKIKIWKPKPKPAKKNKKSEKDEKKAEGSGSETNGDADGDNEGDGINEKEEANEGNINEQIEIPRDDEGKEGGEEDASNGDDSTIKPSETEKPTPHSEL